MSCFLTIDALTLATPDARPLFSDLSLTVGAERVGLVGRNGCGKSTLLRAIAGAVPPAAGSISLTGSMAMLDQHAAEGAASIAAALGVREAWQCLQRILAGEGSEQDLVEADWTLEARAAEAFERVGLAPRALDAPLDANSGGERTRIALARLLMAEPDLILLDEPTNNLDAEGRTAIHDLIAGWRGGVLVASHDRALLEGMDRIVELAPTGISITGGGWSDFEAARSARLERIGKEAERAEAALDQASRSVQSRVERKARSDRAGRKLRASHSQAKVLLDARKERAEGSDGRVSRAGEKQMDAARSRLDAARAQVQIVTPLHIDIPKCGLSPDRRIVELDKVRFARPGGPVLGPVSLEIRGPERVALAGPNGCGKSTLIAVIAGEIDPVEGRAEAYRERFAVLDQAVTLLDPHSSLAENCRRLNPELDSNAVHAALARFGFRNTAALQTAGSLSGGERIRAGLACVLSGRQPPWLLILDEPTNHIDLAAMEILEAALRGYDRALLVVSHDRTFLDRIGIERTVALRPGCG